MEAWGAHRAWGGGSTENQWRVKVEIPTTQGSSVNVSSSKGTRTRAHNYRIAWWRMGRSIAGCRWWPPWSGSNGEAERPCTEGKESRVTVLGALIAKRGSGGLEPLPGMRGMGGPVSGTGWAPATWMVHGRGLSGERLTGGARGTKLDLKLQTPPNWFSPNTTF
jgi:hypothetical protein